MTYICVRTEDSLEHHGILGQKWGRRRFQNEDGSYKNGADGRYADEVDSRSPGSSILKKTKRMSDEDLDAAIERERKKTELTRLQSENAMNEARTKAFMDQLYPQPVQQIQEAPVTKKGMSTTKKLLIGAGALAVGAIVAKKLGVFDDGSSVGEAIKSKAGDAGDLVKVAREKAKEASESVAKEAGNSIKESVKETVTESIKETVSGKKTRKKKVSSSEDSDQTSETSTKTAKRNTKAYDKNGNPKVNSGDLDFALGNTNVKSGYTKSTSVDDFKRFNFDTDSWSMKSVESITGSGRYSGSGENYVRSIAGSIPLTSLLGQYDK